MVFSVPSGGSPDGTGESPVLPRNGSRAGQSGGKRAALQTLRVRGNHTVGSYWPPERKLVEAGYRTIPFPFTETAPPSFRMEAQWTLEELLGYFSTWSATNRYIKATGRNPIEPLAADLKLAWGDVEQRRQIIWPLSVRIGRQVG